MTRVWRNRFLITRVIANYVLGQPAGTPKLEVRLGDKRCPGDVLFFVPDIPNIDFFRIEPGAAAGIHKSGNLVRWPIAAAKGDPNLLQSGAGRQDSQEYWEAYALVDGMPALAVARLRRNHRAPTTS